ncbi:ROK family protein [Haloplanus sp. C73]|uniref:ROK family protein n=1 Tax=Haloplanus sp. C73 TaxID=3421641 RepID=UPI003EBEE463
MTAYLGVDIGATDIRAVVGNRAGEVAGRAQRATPDATGVAITEAVLDAVRAACTDAGVAPDAVVAAGVGSMGPLDADEGAVVDPPNVPGVKRIPLVDPLRTLLSTGRVTLHNDAVAGAIGERLFGDGGDDLVYLTLSTGIGAGAIVDGHVCEGWKGNAAEMGHVTVDPGGRACGCGCAGHWEAYCAGSAIPDYARDLYDGEDTSLALANADAEAVFEAAAAGDDFATRVIERVGRWNALGVATLVHAFAPRTIAVGGGVARNNPAQVLDPIRERLPDHVATGVPEIRAVDADGDAVVRGALASAITDE